MSGKRHPPELIARIKGAVRAGFKYKMLAALTGVSESTIRHSACGNIHKNIEADRFPVERLREWLNGTI